MYKKQNRFATNTSFHQKAYSNNQTTYTEFDFTQTHLNQSTFSTKNQSRLGFKETFLPSIKSGKLSATSTSFKFKYQKIDDNVKQYTRENEKEDPQDQKNEKEIINKLQQSFEEEYSDQHQIPLMGPGSTKVYYDHYKRLKRIDELNDHYQVSDCPQLSMIKKAESLSIIPCKLGIIKEDDSNYQEVKLTNQRWGDKHIQVLTQAVKHHNTKHLYLSNNRIKSVGAKDLLPVAGKKGKIIDLSSNRIGSEGCQALSKVIHDRQSRIEKLNIADNGLGDSTLNSLLLNFVGDTYLKSINISKNNLTSHCCESIAKLIKTNYVLKQLYACWNKINSMGGAIIFEALSSSDFLQVLDLGYNSLGIGVGQCTQKMIDFFQKNSSVLHLDLSKNHFSFNDCQKIAEGLEENHSIYGFHFLGNFGYVDCYGFLCLDDKLDDNFREIHVSHRINGLKTQLSPVRKNFYETRIKDACWICDGWHQQLFEWIPDVSGQGDQPPIYVHFSYEKYNSVYIKASGNPPEFKYLTMVPPGITNFFFTVNDLQTTSQTYAIRDSQEGFLKNIQVGKRRINCQLERINIIDKGPKMEVIDQDGNMAIEVLPRTRPEEYEEPAKKAQVRIWSFPISIWAKDFKFETTEMLRKCFERDWSQCKIPKFVKNQEDLANVKDLLWEHYKQLKETYRFYASYNPAGEVWSISSNPITEFVNTSELIDGSTLKLSDVDLKFIATCSSAIEWKGNPRNPERSLVRYQFMEFLVRLAEDKYIKSKQAQNYLDATQMILNQCLPHMQHNAQKWRDERYFNEQCDDCLKFYKPILDHIYSKYSVRKVKPGHKKFMCMEELHDMCQRANFMDQNFVDRDVNLAFNLSQFLQVDELESDRYFQMYQTEFYEALSRIAEKLSLSRYGQEDV